MELGAVEGAALHGGDARLAVCGGPDEVLRVGVPYLQWRILGVMSMVTTISYKSWFDGLGRTRVHMAMQWKAEHLNELPPAPAPGEPAAAPAEAAPSSPASSEPVPQGPDPDAKPVP